MQIPGTAPTFTTGEHNISNLQALSLAAGFLTNYSYVPAWRYIRTTSDVSLTASTWNVIQWNAVEYDPDGTWNATIYGAQINTPGYYTLESCLQIIQPSANSVFFMQFYLTIGGSNPNYSPGTTLAF